MDAFMLAVGPAFGFLLGYIIGARTEATCWTMYAGGSECIRRRGRFYRVTREHPEWCPHSLPWDDCPECCH